MRQSPNNHIGCKVEVTLSEDTWATGVIRYGDATTVVVEFAEYPELDGSYPTDDVELLKGH